MESQIDNLKEKYWAGKTSVEEEKMIKAFYAGSSEKDAESAYFRKLANTRKEKPPVEFKHPRQRNLFYRWYWAAAILAGIIAGTYFFAPAPEQNEFIVDNPQEAYELTRSALFAVSEGINKGNAYI